jgi:hypothetical protein
MTHNHKINTDPDAVAKAIQDAFVCGSGVVRFWFDGGQLQCDHVPIQDFSEFADALKWASSNVAETKQ